jgi:hypothetical protein
MSKTIRLIQAVFAQPPIPYNPENQTLKGWAMFCLRDRGFIVKTAVPNADFVVETKAERLAFRVSTTPDNLDPHYAWVVMLAPQAQARVIPPQVEGSTPP